MTGVVRNHIRAGARIRIRDVPAPPAGRWAVGAFALLGGLVLMQAVHQLAGLGGSGADRAINVWAGNATMVGSAVMAGWRAWQFKAERPAWLLIAAALCTSALGDLFYTGAAVSLADVFYLAYFPFFFGGLAWLIRLRIRTFDLHRWIDGIAAALLVATPGVVYVLEPTIRASEGTVLEKVVAVTYPVTDIVLLGAVIGAIALAGWRPGRAWLCLCAGLAIYVWADAFYTVAVLEGTWQAGEYDFLWPAAAVIIAASAWMRPVVHEDVDSWGWRAIALPLLCQLAPIVHIFLKDDPPSEQILTVAVLAIVFVQLVVTRPRPPAELGAALRDSVKPTVP